MTEMMVIRFVFVILTIIISSAGQSLINLPNCRSVCGLKVVDDTNFRADIQLARDFTFHNTNICVKDAILPITVWNRSARAFMRYLGMNNENLGCPMENSLTTFLINSVGRY